MQNSVDFEMILPVEFLSILYNIYNEKINKMFNSQIEFWRFTTFDFVKIIVYQAIFGFCLFTIQQCKRFLIIFR